MNTRGDKPRFILRGPLLALIVVIASACNPVAPEGAPLPPRQPDPTAVPLWQPDPTAVTLWQPNPTPEPTPAEPTAESESWTQTMYVGPEQADCVGTGPQKCLLVRETADDRYTFLYHQIDGFEWEAGFEYELLVEVTQVTDPPADGSTLQYRLVEVVSKQAVAVPPPASALDGKWALGRLVIDGEPVRLPYDNTVFLLIEGDRVSGSSGCNLFSGTAAFVKGEVTFGPLAVTTRACEEEPAELEAKVLDLLAEAAVYTVSGHSLEMADAEGTITAVWTPITVKTMIVGPKQADCVGVGPQKCLLAKENAGDEYTFFYGRIDGFDWEARFEYELLVEVIQVLLISASLRLDPLRTSDGLPAS